MQPYQKYEFLQLTEEQKNDNKIFNIMDSIHSQQTNIIELLNRYKTNIPSLPEETNSQRYKNKNNKTIDIVKKNTYHHKSVDQKDLKRKVSERKTPIKLPTFAKKNINPVSKKKQIIESYNVGKKIEENEKKPDDSHVSKRRRNRRKQAIKSILDKERSLKEREDNEEKKKEMDDLLAPIHQIPQPFSHVKKIENHSQSSESEQGEVPISFYQRKYQQNLKQQCKNELNFLYWSKNTDTREWTQQLLNLFAKHDQQIQDLHKKMKFLDKFDEAYFSVQLYKK